MLNSTNESKNDKSHVDFKDSLKKLCVKKAVVEIKGLGHSVIEELSLKGFITLREKCANISGINGITLHPFFSKFKKNDNNKHDGDGDGDNVNNSNAVEDDENYNGEDFFHKCFLQNIFPTESEVDINKVDQLCFSVTNQIVTTLFSEELRAGESAMMDDRRPVDLCIRETTTQSSEADDETGLSLKIINVHGNSPHFYASKDNSANYECFNIKEQETIGSMAKGINNAKNCEKGNIHVGERDGCAFIDDGYMPNVKSNAVRMCERAVQPHSQIGLRINEDRNIQPTSSVNLLNLQHIGGTSLNEDKPYIPSLIKFYECIIDDSSAEVKKGGKESPPVLIPIKQSGCFNVNQNKGYVPPLSDDQIGAGIHLSSVPSDSNKHDGSNITPNVTRKELVNGENRKLESEIMCETRASGGSGGLGSFINSFSAITSEEETTGTVSNIGLLGNIINNLNLQINSKSSVPRAAKSQSNIETKSDDASGGNMNAMKGIPDVGSGSDFGKPDLLSRPKKATFQNEFNLCSQRKWHDDISKISDISDSSDVEGTPVVGAAHTPSTGSKVGPVGSGESARYLSSADENQLSPKTQNDIGAVSNQPLQMKRGARKTSRKSVDSGDDSSIVSASRLEHEFPRHNWLEQKIQRQDFSFPKRIAETSTFLSDRYSQLLGHTENQANTITLISENSSTTGYNNANGVAPTVYSPSQPSLAVVVEDGGMRDNGAIEESWCNEGGRLVIAEDPTSATSNTMNIHIVSETSPIQSQISINTTIEQSHNSSSVSELTSTLNTKSTVLTNCQRETSANSKTTSVDTPNVIAHNSITRMASERPQEAPISSFEGSNFHSSFFPSNKDDVPAKGIGDAIVTTAAHTAVIASDNGGETAPIIERSLAEASAKISEVDANSAPLDLTLATAAALKRAQDLDENVIEKLEAACDITEGPGNLGNEKSRQPPVMKVHPISTCHKQELVTSAPQITESAENIPISTSILISDQDSTGAAEITLFDGPVKPAAVVENNSSRTCNSTFPPTDSEKATPNDSLSPPSTAKESPLNDDKSSGHKTTGAAEISESQNTPESTSSSMDQVVDLTGSTSPSVSDEPFRQSSRSPNHSVDSIFQVGVSHVAYMDNIENIEIELNVLKQLAETKEREYMRIMKQKRKREELLEVMKRRKYYENLANVTSKDLSMATTSVRHIGELSATHRVDELTFSSAFVDPNGASVKNKVDSLQPSPAHRKKPYDLSLSNQSQQIGSAADSSVKHILLGDKKIIETARLDNTLDVRGLKAPVTTSKNSEQWDRKISLFNKRNLNKSVRSDTSAKSISDKKADTLRGVTKRNQKKINCTSLSSQVYNPKPHDINCVAACCDPARWTEPIPILPKLTNSSLGGPMSYPGFPGNDGHSSTIRASSAVASTYSGLVAMPQPMKLGLPTPENMYHQRMQTVMQPKVPYVSPFSAPLPAFQRYPQTARAYMPNNIPKMTPSSQTSLASNYTAYGPKMPTPRSLTNYSAFSETSHQKHNNSQHYPSLGSYPLSGKTQQYQAGEPVFQNVQAWEESSNYGVVPNEKQEIPPMYPTQPTTYTVRTPSATLVSSLHGNITYPQVYQGNRPSYQKNVNAPTKPKTPLESSNKPYSVPNTTMCAVCKNPAGMLCSGCRVVRYCSKQCQILGWKIHAGQCTRLNN